MDWDIPSYYADYDDVEDNDLYPSPLDVAGLIYNSYAKKRNEIMRNYFNSRFNDDGFGIPRKVFRKIEKAVSKLTGPNTDPDDEATFIKALDDAVKDDIKMYDQFEQDELYNYADADFAKYYLHNDDHFGEEQAADLKKELGTKGDNNDTETSYQSREEVPEQARDLWDIMHNDEAINSMRRGM